MSGSAPDKGVLAAREFIAARLRDLEPHTTLDDLARICVEWEDFIRQQVVMFKGPTTYTEACNCGSELPGWHHHDCGVFDGTGATES